MGRDEAVWVCMYRMILVGSKIGVVVGGLSEEERVSWVGKKVRE